MPNSNAVAPTSEPTVIQRYQCTNITPTKSTINNKYWQFSFWEKEGVIQYSWGSVGKEASNSPKTVYGSLRDAERMAAKKTNPRNKPESRYTQVALQSKSAPPASVQLALTANAASSIQSALHPEVAKLVSYVFGTANQHIKSYLQGTIDALSIDQLNEGRKVIVAARNLLPRYQSGSRDQILLETMNRYYNTIPTIISKARVTADDRVRLFYDDLNQFEDRIDQLEAALATYQYTTTHQNNASQAIDPLVQQYQSMGIELCLLPETDSNYEAAFSLVQSTMMSEKAKIHRIYSVHIPNERRKFNQWVVNYAKARGMGDDLTVANNQMFFHGTRRPNVRHILRSDFAKDEGGIKIMATAANGSRFGRGAYFAPKFARSLMYTDYREEGRYEHRGEYWMMFLNQVALGKPKELKYEDWGMIEPPKGYDSVFSSDSNGGRGGEHVIFDVSQQTIRYVMMLEPA